MNICRNILEFFSILFISAVIAFIMTAIWSVIITISIAILSTF